MKLSLPVIVAAVVIIAAVLFLALSSHQGTQTQSPLQSLMAIRLTDPPTVPNGTTSLVISYSKVGVQLSNPQNSSGWIYANSTGTLNLLSIFNVSQTIAAVSVPLNSSIENVRFDITSASIIVNGTTYNVTVPSQIVTAHVSGRANVNGTGSLLMSLSPVVATILTANSTVFVMVPSLRAVVIGSGTNSSSVRAGYVARLNRTERADLADARPNITLSNTSIAVQGNTTTVSATLSNNANRTIYLRHISFFGKLSVELNNTGIQQHSLEVETELGNLVRNSSACATKSNVTATSNTTSNLTVTTQDRPEVSANVSVTGTLGQGTAGSSDNGFRGNASANVTSGNVSQSSGDSSQNQEGGNASASGEVSNSDFGHLGEDLGSSYHLNINNSICTSQGLLQVQSRLKERITNATAVQQHLQTRLGMISLLVLSNGTIIAPAGLEDFNETGYALAAGSSHTFTFSGQLSQGESNLLTTPMAASVYRVVVTGESDARASANVTAS